MLFPADSVDGLARVSLLAIYPVSVACRDQNGQPALTASPSASTVLRRDARRRSVDGNLHWPARCSCAGRSTRVV